MTKPRGIICLMKSDVFSLLYRFFFKASQNSMISSRKNSLAKTVELQKFVVEKSGLDPEKTSHVR